MSSIFARPGENRANTLGDRQMEASAINVELLRALQPMMQKSIEFRGQMQPNIEALVQHVLGLGKQQNVLGRTAAIANGATTNAARAGRAAQANFGTDSHIGKGVMVDALNKGNTAANTYQADAYDPQKMAADSASLVQFLMGATRPDMGPLGGLTAGVFGQPAPHVGQGIGDMVGYALGQFTGGKTSSGKW